MARPIKPGLDYFSFDTDFWHDRKIKQLRRSFGDKGVSVFLYLICEIYRDKGYYIIHNEELIVDVANELGTSENLIVDILKLTIGIGLFDKEKFESNNVLTSKRIQENYQSAKRLQSMGERPYVIEETPEEIAESDFQQEEAQTVTEAKTSVPVATTDVIVTKTPVTVTKTQVPVAETEPEIPDYDSYVPDKSEKFSPAFIQLLDDIGERFGTDGRCYATQLDKLLRDIHSPTTNGIDTVRAGLNKLDTAEAIKSGKVQMNISKFLRTDIFLKLLSGEYDIVFGTTDSNPLNLPLSMPVQSKRINFRNSRQGKPPAKIDELY